MTVITDRNRPVDPWYMSSACLFQLSLAAPPLCHTTGMGCCRRGAKRLSREDRHGGAAGQSLVRNTKRTRRLRAGTMAAVVASAPVVSLVDAENVEREDAVPSHVFPFLRLPRELRDQVYISPPLYWSLV
jgi:hypothetical protein